MPKSLWSQFRRLFPAPSWIRPAIWLVLFPMQSLAFLRAVQSIWTCTTAIKFPSFLFEFSAIDASELIGFIGITAKDAKKSPPFPIVSPYIFISQTSLRRLCIRRKSIGHFRRHFIVWPFCFGKTFFIPHLHIRNCVDQHGPYHQLFGILSTIRMPDTYALAQLKQLV